MNIKKNGQEKKTYRQPTIFQRLRFHMWLKLSIYNVLLLFVKNQTTHLQ